MKKNIVYDVWRAEEQTPFSGWDFSRLGNRWCQESLPWDYKALVKQYLQPQHMLLDMGTGGGEFLLSLNHPYANTAVTESWPPNIQICQQKLAPLGVTVYATEEHAPLPIESAQFDVVINRQASYDAMEVWRVLKPGGVFITQQVGSENCLDFALAINPDYSLPNAFCLQTEVPKFEEIGFQVKLAEEAYPMLQFTDIGAFVYWAKQISWTFPGFSVANNFAQLCALQKEVERQGFISGKQHRFMLIAQK